MIRLAVAGMAHNHVNDVFAELPHRPQVRLVAASDPDIAVRERYADRVDGPIYADHRELLERHEVDVVAVAGVYAQRAEVVVDALGARAHVLADKPLCTDLDQLAAIEAAVPGGDGDRVVSVMFSKRGSPITIAARALVADGVLGDLTLIASTGPHKLLAPQRPEWFFRRDGYGGVLGDLPVHDIDLVLAFTGATSGIVVGSAGRSAVVPEHPEFEDHGALLMTAGDVTATIDAHWMSPDAAPVHGRYRMRLTGTAGTAELDWAYGELEVATHTRDTWRPELPPGIRAAEDFFDALLEGRPPEVGTAESLAATRIALLAQRSAERANRPEPWAATG